LRKLQMLAIIQGEKSKKGKEVGKKLGLAEKVTKGGGRGGGIRGEGGQTTTEKPGIERNEITFLEVRTKKNGTKHFLGEKRGGGREGRGSRGKNV